LGLHTGRIALHAQLNQKPLDGKPFKRFLYRKTQLIKFHTVLSKNPNKN
jgi:hypothetical protein